MSIEILWRIGPQGEAPPKETADLIQAYWERDEADTGFLLTHAEVQQRFGVSAPVISAAVKQWGCAVVPGMVCSGCGAGMTASNRTEYNSWRRRFKTPFLCEACRASERQRQQAAADALAVARRRHLQEHWNGYAMSPVPAPQHFSLRQTVLVLALVRSRANENMLYFDPDSESEMPFAPKAIAHALLTELWEDDLIGVHPGSQLEAFDWQGDAAVAESVDVHRAHLVIPGTDTNMPFTLLVRALEERVERRDFAGEWEDALAALQREIWKGEVLDYLQLLLRKHNMGGFTPGEKTHLVLDRMLKHYSLGQCWAIVYRAVTKSAAALATGMPHRQAVNSTITRMDGFTDRALAEGWAISPYRRDYDLPVSALAGVVWESLLRRPVHEAVAGDVLPAARDTP